MKRIGVYDAFDKWDILCRYWEDRESAANIGTDEMNKPLVPKWNRVAMMCGFHFGFESLAGRLQSPRPGMTTGVIGDPAGAAEPSVEAEIAQLAAQFGLAGLQSRFRGLVEAITGAGFQAAFDGDLSPRLARRMRQFFKQGALEGLQWTEDDCELPTVPVLRYWAGEFPATTLKHKSNALSIFCCRFYGRADVIHIHDAHPDAVTLVDNDASRMADMKLIYPPHWNYITADYEEFLAEAVASGRSYDFIVADQWAFMGKTVAWDLLPAIMKICSDTFITNYRDEMFEELNLRPTDLAALSEAVSEKTGTEIAFTQIMPRSKPAYWAVMRNMSGRPNARGAIAAISRRTERDRSPLRRQPAAHEVMVIGPSARWSEVSPEGSFDLGPEAPALTYPQSGSTTGPSPLLHYGFYRQDNGEPVDIVIQITGDDGVTYFRLKLGNFREVDLRKLGLALPAGEAKIWVLYRRSPEVRWSTYRRVDFRIDPDAPDHAKIV